MKFNTSYKPNAPTENLDIEATCDECIQSLNELSTAIAEYKVACDQQNTAYDYSDNLDENPLVYTDESFKDFVINSITKVMTLSKRVITGLKNLFSSKSSVISKIDDMPHITKVLNPSATKEYRDLIKKLDKAIKSDHAFFYKLKASISGTVAFYGLSYDDSRDIATDVLSIFNNFSAQGIKQTSTTLLGENLYMMSRELSVAATWDIDKAKEISKQLSEIQNKWEFSIKSKCDKIIERVNDTTEVTRKAEVNATNKATANDLTKLMDYTSSDQINNDTIQLRIAAICFKYAEMVKKSVNSYLVIADRLLGAIEKEEKDKAAAEERATALNNINNDWN